VMPTSIDVSVLAVEVEVLLGGVDRGNAAVEGIITIGTVDVVTVATVVIVVIVVTVTGFGDGNDVGTAQDEVMIVAAMMDIMGEKRTSYHRHRPVGNHGRRGR